MAQRKWLIRIVCFLLLTVCLFIGDVIITEMERVYEIPLLQNEQFTEEAVIRVSREALIKAGKDISKMEPRSYRHELGPGENYFARNTLNSDDGYILWRENGGPGYTVQVERREGYIICRVGKNK